MEYSNLNNLISSLQYGTKLHIGVLFLGSYGNIRLAVPYRNTIHSSHVCVELKSKNMGYQKCYKCRNAAIEKAIRTGTPFGGYCVNGVYEYTHPVVIDGDVVCIIFIGNILDTKHRETLDASISDKPDLADTMEADFSFDSCRCAGGVIESYIRMILELSSKDDVVFEPLMENIKKFIEENIECDISIADVARIFHYNEKYLGRLFKKKTDKTFSQYIIHRRLEIAKRHLISSRDTVLSISESVGFRNVTYFNRMFQKYSGMTPTEFRHIYSE